MAVIGRNFRPVVQTELCNTCSICVEQCPAYVDEGFRSDRESIRGKIFQSFTSPPSPMATPIEASIPPCQATCPIHQDVRGYLKAVAERRFSDAVALIRRTNPLPLICGTICPHPCESECLRGVIDEPLAIRAVKRFAALYEKENELIPAITASDTGKRVAIIGSGPAGIAAAYTLRQHGVTPVIFEKDSQIGGMLSWAIPDFRLPRDILEYEIGVLKKLGITFVTHKTLGKDLSLETLRQEGFHAIILAIGATRGKKVALDSPEDFKNHLDCLEFLSLVHQGVSPDLGGAVAVIGGGNAAIDTARVLKRQGIPDITVVYRRTAEQMPADQSEVQEAASEGIQFRYSSLPTALEENNDLWFLRGFETRSAGRRMPVEVLKDKPFSIPVSGVVSAISQVPETSWARGEGIALTPDGTIEVDENMKTSIDGLYSAGDGVTGPSTVVEAMASGTSAAKAVLKSLSGEKQD